MYTLQSSNNSATLSLFSIQLSYLFILDTDADEGIGSYDIDIDEQLNKYY